MAAKVSGDGGGKYELRQNSEINVTPFVDIMLVLLIVMMVAAPVATLAVKIDLPPVRQDKLRIEPPTFVSIRQSGAMLISNPARGERATALPRLAGDLVTDLGPTARDASILIRADRTVRFSDFMSVVNQLQADGFYKVSVITENAPVA